MQDSTKNKRQGDDLVERLWLCAESLAIITWAGLKEAIKKFLDRPLETLAIQSILFLAIYKITMAALHLRILAWIWPALFSGRFLGWLYHLPSDLYSSTDPLPDRSPCSMFSPGPKCSPKYV